MTTLSNCIFCQICEKKSPATIYYEDEEIIVFKDIHPASDYHFLCIPKHHIGTIKNLHSKDVPFLTKLINVGKQVLIDQGGDVNDVLMGFHWPPFNSVDHLHLHVISPPSKMSFIHRQMFKVQSFWFVTPDYAMDYIQNKLWYGIKHFFSQKQRSLI